MNNSTLNLSTPETSANSTIQSIELIDILEISVYSINFLVGLPTHSCILWLIIRGTRRGVALAIFNLNFTICEIGNCLNSLLPIFPVCFSGLSLVGIPLFLLGLVLTSRPLFQCLVCVERYLAVVHPVTFLKYKPLRYRLICCAVAWIIIIGSCFYGMITLTAKNDRTYTLFMSLQFLLFLSIQLFCLVAVLRALKQSGPGERTRETEENHMKRRAFFIILITTVCTVIIYVPYIITGLAVILTQQKLEGLWLTSLVCYVFTSFVHPVLYLHRTVKLPCIFSS